MATNAAPAGGSSAVDASLDGVEPGGLEDEEDDLEDEEREADEAEAEDLAALEGGHEALLEVLGLAGNHLAVSTGLRGGGSGAEAAVAR